MLRIFAITLAMILALELLVLWRDKIVHERKEEERRVKEAHERLAREVVQRRAFDTSRSITNAMSATINQAAGVFKQVSTIGEPIFKRVRGGKWGMRQISTSGQPIFKPSYFGSAVNGLGKIAWIGAVAIEASNVAVAVDKDEKEGTINNTVYAASNAIGSWTGAAYGASAGAALLSFIPGVGPLVGGIAGGFIGAYAGRAAIDVAVIVVSGKP